MLAAISHSFGKPLTIEHVDIDAPAPNEVRVRVMASGVCHSDRTMQMGAQDLPLPMVFGHEPAGVVEAVGSDVSYVSVGDRVVTCPSSFCGHCSWCQRGLLQHCENKGRTRGETQTPRLSQSGVKVEQFVGIGAFAEELLVHERSIVKIPDEIPFDCAALLGCSVITGMGAVRHAAQVTMGDTVAIVGCGGVGLNAIQAARLLGASRVIAVDRIDTKLEMAKRLGATDTVNASVVDPVEAVRELTSGGVDHAIEVVGVPATMEQAFAMLKTRGTLTVVGVAAPDIQFRVPAAELLLEKRIQGTKLGSARPRLDIPVYADMYLRGDLKIEELITSRFSLEDVNLALDALDNPVGGRSVLSLEN